MTHCLVITVKTPLGGKPGTGNVLTHYVLNTEVGEGDNRVKLRFQSWHLITCSDHKIGPGKCIEKNIATKKHLPLEEKKPPDKRLVNQRGDPGKIIIFFVTKVLQIQQNMS